MGRIAAIRACSLPQPYPVCNQHRGDQPETRPIRVLDLGREPRQVYEAADKLMEKLRPIRLRQPVLRPVHHPRIAASTSGAIRRRSAEFRERILGLLAKRVFAELQYLIKKPDDQYQVILEVQDKERSNAEASRPHIKSTTARTWSRLNALVTWRTRWPPGGLNHLNQSPASRSLQPERRGGGRPTDLSATARESSRHHPRQPQARRHSATPWEPDDPHAAGCLVMYVVLLWLYESYCTPWTVLSSLPMRGRRLAHSLDLPRAGLAYAYVGMFMLMGIVKKNGIMIVDFALQRIGEVPPPAGHPQRASIRFRPII